MNSNLMRAAMTAATCLVRAFNETNGLACMLFAKIFLTASLTAAHRVESALVHHRFTTFLVIAVRFFYFRNRFNFRLRYLHRHHHRLHWHHHRLHWHHHWLHRHAHLLLHRHAIHLHRVSTVRLLHRSVLHGHHTLRLLHHWIVLCNWLRRVDMSC